MTLDELKEKMRALGLDPNNPSWTQTGKVDVSDLHTIQEHRKVLEQVKGLLEKQIEIDQSKALALREQLARNKRGGGS